jgi:hypothetical protein
MPVVPTAPMPKQHATKTVGKFMNNSLKRNIYLNAITEPNLSVLSTAEVRNSFHAMNLILRFVDRASRNMRVMKPT